MRILARQDTSREDGFIAETEFSDFATERGWRVVEATKNQNIYDHIDYFLFKDGKQLTVDVKAEKKIGRYDQSTQEEFLWVELKNVRGYSGWLSSKADCIVFQRGKEYWFVKTNKLKGRVYLLLHQAGIDIDSEEYVSMPSEAYCKLYQRAGREDVLTMIRFEDIRDISKIYERS